MTEFQNQIMDQAMVEYDQAKKMRRKTYYTIGILLNQEYTRVLLIQKTKPAWQKGKFNFPGGHIEPGEHPAECVSREFKEETNLDIPAREWSSIGDIENLTGDQYAVAIYASIYDPKKHGEVKSLTEEKALWFRISDLHILSPLISNVPWLTHFAINFYAQGNKDKLVFGKFTYED